MLQLKKRLISFVENLNPVNFDGVVESPISAPQEVPLGCKAQRFFTPLIFSGGIWNFLLSHPALIQRLFTTPSFSNPAKDIDDTI